MSNRIFGWDYPAGAEHDPNAPWNQRDPELCPTCNGENPAMQTCETCESAGVVYPPSRADLAAERADYEHDRAKDEREYHHNHDH